MNHLKVFGLAALAAALMAVVVTGTASATIIENGSGTAYGSGTKVTAKNEGTVTLHPEIGTIECTGSTVSGKTTNAGGIVEGKTVGVKGDIETLSWSGCNAKVETLVPGSLEIVSSGKGNGTLYGTGNEVTVELFGFHCIFKTNNTKLGTVTGSANTKGAATLDIEATIPRTGGRSGGFCGATAQWTGSYEVTAPNPLYVT